MIIDGITTKFGQVIDLGPLTVLVGPNNSGKSQTLREVMRLFLNTERLRLNVLESIRLGDEDSIKDVLARLEVVDDPNRAGILSVRGLKEDLAGNALSIAKESLAGERIGPRGRGGIGQLNQFRIAYLNAETRLSAVRASEAYNTQDAAPGNLVQGLFRKVSTEKRLREVFRETFGLEVGLDVTAMTRWLLRVGVTLEGLSGDPRVAREVAVELERLDDQGDGFRGFVGVVLALLLTPGRVVLLDEPELFLHPAQARQLGAWIGRNFEGLQSQVMIATHSSHFLAGLASTSDELRIYRLNRSADRTGFTGVSAEDTQALSASPLLSSQRVTEALFHRGVILCEGESDRAVYQAVAAALSGGDEAFFLQAYNKQSISKIVPLLRRASIPVVAIADLDLITDEGEFLATVESLDADNGALEKMKGLRREVMNSIEQGSEASRISTAVESLKAILDQQPKSIVSLRRGIKGVARRMSDWAGVKDRGVDAFFDHKRASIESLLTTCRSVGLFLVPVGELENWMPLKADTKAGWVIWALSNLKSAAAPAELSAFVRDAILALSNTREDK